jgi:hypothetical protein
VPSKAPYPVGPEDLDPLDMMPGLLEEEHSIKPCRTGIYF